MTQSRRIKASCAELQKLLQDDNPNLRLILFAALNHIAQLNARIDTLGRRRSE